MSRNSWIGLVSSVLVVAAALGVLALLRATAGPALALPDRVGDLAAADTEAAYAGGTVDDAIERSRSANAASDTDEVVGLVEALWDGLRD